MKTAAPPKQAEGELKNWLYRELAAPKEANAEEISTAVFDAIERNGFSANQSLSHATCLITDQPLSEEVREQITEGALHREVSEYASECLKLDLAERKRRFNALRSRCKGFSHLVARLNELKPLLSFKPIQLDKLKPKPKLLTELLLQLFLLPPSKRGEVQHQMLLGTKSEPKEWMKARKNVKAKFRQIAAAKKEFLGDIACWKYKKKGIYGSFSVLFILGFVFLFLLGLVTSIGKEANRKDEEQRRSTQQTGSFAGSESDRQKLLAKPWQEIVTRHPDSFKVHFQTECFELENDQFLSCLNKFSKHCESRLPAILKHPRSCEVQYDEISSVVKKACKRSHNAESNKRYNVVLKRLGRIGKQLKSQIKTGSKGGKR